MAVTAAVAGVVVSAAAAGYSAYSSEEQAQQVKGDRKDAITDARIQREDAERLRREEREGNLLQQSMISARQRQKAAAMQGQQGAEGILGGSSLGAPSAGAAPNSLGGV